MIKLNKQKIDERWKEVENTSCGGRRAKKYCNYFLKKTDDKNYLFIEKINLPTYVVGVLIMILFLPLPVLYCVGKFCEGLIGLLTKPKFVHDAIAGVTRKGVLRDDHLYEKDLEKEKYYLTEEQLKKLKGN